MKHTNQHLKTTKINLSYLKKARYKCYGVDDIRCIESDCKNIEPKLLERLLLQAVCDKNVEETKKRKNYGFCIFCETYVNECIIYIPQFLSDHYNKKCFLKEKSKPIEENDLNFFSYTLYI